MTEYRPYSNYLLLQTEAQPEKSEGGIFFAPLYQDKANEGIIIALGPDCKHVSDGGLQEGNRVIFTKHAEYEFEDSEEKDAKGKPILYTAVQESNVILCKRVIKEDPKQGKLPLARQCRFHDHAEPCPLCAEERRKRSQGEV